MSFLSSRLVFVALTMVISAFQVMAQYSVTMPYKQVTIKEVDGVASFSGASVAGKPGQPALPAYTVTFLLPPDADLSSVSVAINNSTDQELSGQYTVAPNVKIPGPDGKITWPKGMVIVDGKDMAIYSNDAYFQPSYTGTVQTGMMQQYKLVAIQIYPYKYNPVSQKLRMITGGSLNVSYKSGSSSMSLPRRADVEKILKLTVTNQSEFDVYGNAPSSQLKLQSAQTSSVASAASPTTVSVATASLSGSTYLIITTNAIVNSTPALTTYKNMLTQKGATVELATEDAWNFPVTSVTQAKCDNIRNYVTGRYYINSRSGHPLKYVLLIGNPDTTSGDVPMKNWNSIDFQDDLWANGIPTDYYYADLGNDWLTSGPDKWSEVTVGRIPFYGDVNVVNNYLNRAIAYENASGDAVEWRRSYLGLAEILGLNPESYAQSENLVAAIKNQGWSYKRVYSSYGTVWALSRMFTLLSPVINMNPLADYSVMNVNVVAKMWNSEAPGFVYAGGHGGPNGVLNVLQSFPGACPENVSQISSNYPAAVVAASCETSDPIEPNNCGAAILYKNAISYAGFSVSVYGPASTTEPYSLNVLANSPFGDALVAAKSTSGNLVHCLQFNLYGCPEASLNLQTIDTSITPQNVKVTISSTTPGFDITWNAVPGATQYKIERSETHSGAIKDGFAQIGVTGSGVVKYTDNNIAPGTCYKYRVYALNSSNQRGSYSQIDSSTSFYRIPNLSCGTPTNLTVTATHSNLVSLGWSGAANAAYYNVKRSTSNNGPFVTVTDVYGNNTVSTYLTDYNVTNGVTYYYTVSAVNQYGQSNNSNVVAATPSFDLAPPAIPSDGISDHYDNNGVLQTTINWQSVFNNEVFFKFEWAMRYPDGDYGTTHSFGPINRGATSFTWSNIGYNNNTELVFRMRGFADDGTVATAYSDFYPFTSTPGLSRAVPSAPGLTATPSQTTITLNWTYVLSSDPDLIPKTCLVYYKQNGGSWKQLIIFGGYPTNTYTYTGANPNTNYQFCARTIFTDLASGMSCYSRFTPVVSTTTLPTDPCSGVQGGGSGLKGTVFGLNPPYAAGSEYCKATDGDINTYYDYSQADGGYTGLFLGYTAKVIEKIRFYPRAGNGSRMNGGKFQGSNTSSSSGFVDLYTISYTPSVQWNEVHISNSTAYRWVRYLSPTGGYCNIAELEFYLPPPQSPAYNGPHNIANGATLQVEDFDNGGEGVAYHDNDASNSGGQYRTNEGVDIENPTTGVTNVGWTNAGEWMDYTCNVTAGTYNITLYAASPNTATQQVNLYQDNKLKATFTVPNTGGWQTYQAITVKGVSLAYNSASVLEIESTTGGYNLDKLTIATSTTFPDPTKWYKIATRANTNLCLDVTGGNYANNTAIELWTKSSVNQEFQFKDAGNGYYTITCRNNTNYSIDMGGNFLNSQTLILWTTDVNNANQKFKLVPITGGYYRLETSNSSFSIDNWGAGGDGVKPALWTSDNNNVNQQWVISEVQ